MKAIVFQIITPEWRRNRFYSCLVWGRNRIGWTRQEAISVFQWEKLIAPTLIPEVLRSRLLKSIQWDRQRRRVSKATSLWMVSFPGGYCWTGPCWRSFPKHLQRPHRGQQRQLRGGAGSHEEEISYCHTQTYSQCWPVWQPQEYWVFWPAELSQLPKSQPVITHGWMETVM